MGFRVDSVSVQIVLNVEFEGSKTISFSFVPEKQFDFDLDPLVRGLLDKNDATLKALAAANPPTDLFLG
jgi:hypothetical protein